MINVPAPSPLNASTFYRMHTTLLAIKANMHDTTTESMDYFTHSHDFQ
jgi:hypothetical protein